MKTPSSIRVKMRKNDISEESKKKSVKLTPIKKNSKESKQFLHSDFDEEGDDLQYKSRKTKSTLDYFDGDDDDDFDDDDLDLGYDDEDYDEDYDDEDYDEEDYDEEEEEEM
ncbi:MAG: hypothetical protein R3Y26_02425 [Rikenellaceae bacterium]